MLRTLGLPHGTVTDGFSVSVYFFDQLMKYKEC